MAFIIDTYNKYDAWDRAHSKYVYCLNEQWYAIKEVQLEWGKPILPFNIENNRDPNTYYVYDTIDSAMKYVQQIKTLNIR